MRTGKLLSGAVAALALLASAGCYETQYVYCYPDGTQVLVGNGCAPQARVVAPAPVVAPRVVTQTVTVAEKPVQVVVAAPARQVVRQVVQPAQAVQTVQAVQIVAPDNAEKANRQGRWMNRRPCAEHRIFACEPCKGTVVLADPVVKTVVVAEQPKIEEKVLVIEPAKKTIAGRTVTVLQRGRKGRYVCLGGVPAGTQIVYAQPAAVVAAPAVVVAEPAVVSEPVFVEPVAAVSEPIVEEPSWMKYLAPEQPIAVSGPAPLAEPVLTVQPVEYAAGPQALPAEPYIVDAPVYAGASQQPIVIQPIIQPIIQTGSQDVLSGQIMAPVQTYAAAPATTIPQYAAPVMPPLPQSLLSDPSVCGPGQNCFTLPENQLAAGPQILTPSAAAPLTVQSAPAASAAAPALSIGSSAATQDKYGALTAALSAPEETRASERPEVSMPAPLGRTTTPPIAGTNEIENALDVMLGNTSPMLK